MGKCIAVTGANGLVGRALCQRLMSTGAELRALTRDGQYGLPGERAVGDIGPDTAWEGGLRGVDGVVHCAARVHVMDPAAGQDEAAFQRVNAQGTRRLAEAAARAGVRRLVFLSTIKVNGESAPPDAPFTAQDSPQPADAYARSKAAAEAALWQVAADTGLEVVVIRPPLVHAPNAGGNLAALRRLVRLGLPLPLGAAQSPRAVIGIDNLVDGIVRCLSHTAASGRVWLMRDAEMPTVAELVGHLARADGRRPRLIPVPRGWLRSAARVTGQSARVRRLLEPLCMDITDTQTRLDWQPPRRLAEGLQRLGEDPPGRP